MIFVEKTALRSKTQQMRAMFGFSRDLFKFHSTSVESICFRCLIEVGFFLKKSNNFYCLEIADTGKLTKKLIFVEMKRTADLIATMLSDEGIKAQTVNGDRTQELREQATAGFRSGEYLVLVVTNVFARGI